jgi:hypothetical protein
MIGTPERLFEEAYVQARREFEKLGATDTRAKVGTFPSDLSGKGKA